MYKRQLFGNPVAVSHTHSWPLDHPVLTAFAWSVIVLAVVVPASVRRYRARTTD